MKTLIMTLTLFLVLIPVSYGQAETRFFESLYDVPVMPGLVELPEMALNFDKPEGRISQAGAVTQNADKKAILTFYGQALPQLGWKPLAEGQYRRESEKLMISIEKTGVSSLVRFSLSPYGS